MFDVDLHELNYNFDYNPVETAALREKHANRQLVEINDIRRIALWKLNRIINISDELLAKINQLIIDQSINLDSPLSKEVICELVKEDGIWYPMASAILKFLRPDVFPIIDVRAYRAVTGQKIYHAQYNFDVYHKYDKELRKIQCNYNKKLQKIGNCNLIRYCEMDEQLYCWDKEHNGTI